ncbi:hypothetical protein ACIBHX_01870 [Nonomuraea sp. NPDC050536]|uniref:hypothetical protein n=1 Tax=Nonomuraea sp. NPDC050536 TaxID=3364366 RepID=UPI0037C52088
MSDDAFWALVNVAVVVVMVAANGVVLWLNTIANRRQMERLAREYGWPERES